VIKPENIRAFQKFVLAMIHFVFMGMAALNRGIDHFTPFKIEGADFPCTPAMHLRSARRR
jgi:hypothetical protein